MSKIVIAVNKMISNSEKITGVIQKGNEMFFIYDEKYKWSIMFRDSDNNYSLYYYPGNVSIEALATTPSTEWQDMNYVSYSTDVIRTKEAYNSFQELYQITKEKVLGIDKVLDDIIGR